MSSHDPFTLLGLERRTATERDVKKAYAAKLKQIRPEDDREGFMALRAAFEHARSMARWRDQYPEEAAQDDAYEDGTYIEPEDDEDTYDEEPDGTYAQATLQTADTLERQNVRDDHDFSPAEIDTTPIAMPATENSDWQTHSNDSPADPVDVAMDEIDTLMKNPFAGGSMEPWQAILDRDDLQTIDAYQQMSQRLRWRLCTDTGFGEDPQVLKVPAWLTMPVFKGLCEHFGWHKQQSREYWVMQQQNWLRTIDTYLTSGKTVLPNDGFQQSHSPQQQTETKTSPWRIVVRVIWVAAVLYYMISFLVGMDDRKQTSSYPNYQTVEQWIDENELEPGEHDFSEIIQRARQKRIADEMSERAAENVKPFAYSPQVQDYLDKVNEHRDQEPQSSANGGLEKQKMAIDDLDALMKHISEREYGESVTTSHDDPTDP